ncbi:MAG: hypothetical protein CSA50_02055 [Gammaproteobacteria bacterium]|nr:MAG: hypothetical protein CSA50_02055 [Gammaproteobacteria bacterium]
MMWSIINRLFSKKGSTSPLALGIEIAPTGVCVAVLARNAASAPVVKASAYFPCSQSDWATVLRGFCRNNDLEGADLKGVKTYVAFHPDYYQLMLIDAPEVPDEELADAVKWRVKDFVHGDMENYVVDAFRLPEDAYRGRMNMIYAAYIQKELVMSVVELCERLGLHLMTIGVSELARVNLTMGREEYANLGVAFLHMDEQKGQIDLMENGCLYMSRGIDTGYAMFDQGAASATSNLGDGGLDLLDNALGMDNSDRLDGLVLNIQRSLDYYESQLGKNGISKLMLLTPMPLSSEICENLSAKLPVSVEAFQINSLLDCQQDCSGFMDSCSVAVGAALGGADAAD